MTLKTTAFTIQQSELQHFKPSYLCNKYKQYNMQLSTNKSGLVSILVTGKDTEDIKRQIKSEICKTYKKSADIEQEKIKFVIGKGGNVLKAITQKTRVKLNVVEDKRIEVVGDKEGIEMACACIDEILKSVKTKKEIKVETFELPFLNLKFNLNDNDNILVVKNVVCIKGSEAEVATIYDYLFKEYEQLKNDLKKLILTIPANKHKYVAMDPKDFFKETECIYYMDGDHFVLVGYESSLSRAMQRVLLRTSEINVAVISIEPQQKLYLSHHAVLLQEMEEKYKCSIILNDNSVDIVTHCTSLSISSVQKDIRNMLANIPYEEIEVSKEVMFYLFNDAIISDITNRFPQTLITRFDTKLVVFSKQLENVLDRLQSTIQSLLDSNLTILDVKRNYHFLFKKQILTYLDQSPSGQLVIKLLNDRIVLKGPKDEVQQAIDWIETCVNKLKTQKIDNMEFDIDTAAVAHVVGKKGQNLQKLIDEFNVSVDLNKGEQVTRVVVKGFKENILEVKQKILQVVDNVLNAVQVFVQVEKQYHKSLIGSGGKYVRRLEDDYNVRIDFGDEGVVIKGTETNVEDASKEILELVEFEKQQRFRLDMQVPSEFVSRIVGRGGSKISEIRSHSSTKIEIGSREDETVAIVITGNEDACYEAEKLINLTMKKDRVNKSLEVPHILHKQLIGKGGKRIKEIVDALSNGNVKVQFPEQGDEVVVSGPERMASGVLEALEEAVAELMQDAVRFKTETKVDCQKLAHEFRIKCIQSEGEIILLGSKDACERAKSAVLDKRMSKEITVPKEFHKFVVGRNGQMIRSIKERCGCDIRVSKDSDAVTIKGGEEGIAAAEALILAIVEKHGSNTKSE